MDRAIPSSANEDIELYMRTYYSLLRSSGEIQIKSLIETHAQIDSSLHLNAREDFPDMAAFVYCALRLPTCIKKVRLVLLGQADEVFGKAGFADVPHWREVNAAGRRRRLFFDGKEVLAAFIASASDIDDLIPILTAYQIEWNKIHDLLQQSGAVERLRKYAERGTSLTDDERAALAQDLRVNSADVVTLENIWGSGFFSNLQALAETRKEFALRLLAGSLVDYHKATQRWWDNIARQAGALMAGRPVYFVSSNMHSLANLISGHALAREEELIAYIEDIGHEDLMEEYRAIQAEATRSSKENFLYYVLKKYSADAENAQAVQAKLAGEAEVGLTTIPSDRYLDVGAQIFELKRLIPARLDPRLPREGLENLRRSEAVIFNIDYPLGLAAYQIFSEISQNVEQIRGFYLMGKSATLNGRIGDVIIPNVVYDEHSQNTYLFNNCFSARDVEAYLTFGSVLDNQKAISVKGTFLQNRTFVELFYREGYTDIEMEAGPYLSALYEMSYPKRYPVNEIVRLYQTDFDIGFLHYASDTPYSKGKNLGAVHPSYFGMDPTYATALAILRRIIARETE
ncbi:MAG: hypothetical protein KGJ80_12315 [Chloroflexota bacterium]|nr:hypothetical protein [Chloroflexota bacterium]